MQGCFNIHVNKYNKLCNCINELTDENYMIINQEPEKPVHYPHSVSTIMLEIFLGKRKKLMGY